MEERYWQSITVGISGIIGLLFCISLVVFLKIINAKNISNRFTIVTIVISLLGIIFCSFILVPYAKDYRMVVSECYEEYDLYLVEYTYIRDNLDGNGETDYLKPKFYIADKDEYIILSLTNLEVGKTYRIRYYPNCQIAEVLYCVDDMENEM